MFELSRSYVSASWCIMNSCMARIGEQGMPLGFPVQRVTNSELERARGEREREREIEGGVGREGERERGSEIRNCGKRISSEGWA